MSSVSNHQQQHSHQEESGKQPLAETHDVVHDACQLLESSLSALVADAAVLRQLVGLKQAIMDGNNDSQDLCLKLIQIDRIVTELENKMKTFRDVVKEEQKTIGNIEKCAAGARAKVEEFQQWRNRVLQQHQQQQQQHGYHDSHNDAFGEQQETLTHDDRKDWQSAYRPQNPRDENDNIWGLSHEQQDDYNDNHLQEEMEEWQEGEDAEYFHHDTQNSGYDGGEDDNDGDDDALVKMDWVTQEEFMQVEPHTRAHISRSLVNEAVQDIQQMFQEKETSRRRERRRNRAMLTWNQKHNNQEEVLTCSEQEMRQSCGFFCSGESSARSVLMILRNLGRIKQIPSGNGKIVYALN